jgi:hypothetical protein
LQQVKTYGLQSECSLINTVPAAFKISSVQLVVTNKSALTMMIREALSSKLEEKNRQPKLGFQGFISFPPGKLKKCYITLGHGHCHQQPIPVY